MPTGPTVGSQVGAAAAGACGLAGITRRWAR